MKLLTLALLLATPLAAQQPEDLVHPLVGTQNEGQTYPAVGLPFAMTQWTPQTRDGEIKCIAPYYFTDPKIQGFRGSHFVSGSCLPDYGSMTIMPGVGPLKTDAVQRASSFDRLSEHATPYEYSVELAEPRIDASITGLLRSGIMQFRFTHAEKDAWIVLANNARGGEGWVRIHDGEVTGQVPIRREYAGSGKLAGFSSYFVIQFSKSITSSGTYIGAQTKDGAAEQTGDGKPAGVINVAKMMTSTGGASGAATTMPTSAPRPGFGVYVHLGEVKAGEVVRVRIGNSFTSVEEARKNLQAEIPAWDYEAAREQARAAWHTSLSAIELHTATPASTIFYTALYHALLHPRTYSDADGSYPRFHAHGEVEQAKGFTYYDDFSMWDIFRAQLPLLTILDPARDAEMMQSLVVKGQQGGYLPIFPAWNSYTSEMVGDHSTVALIDAYNKGIRNFDVPAAYALMRKNATEIPSSREEYLDGKGRRGLPSYLKYGYIPLEDHIDDAFHKNEQVSRTLEYAYDDAILATFSKTLGHSDDAALFAKQGESWRNVIDPRSGFARGRNQDGTWVSSFDPTKRPTWITEGTPFVYTFFVPQNVEGLVKHVGGKAAFSAKLDALFSQNLYDHGNEPSHHIIYLYNAAGQPYKAQQHIRSAMETQYKDGPDGLAGNDDAGQMSAWYVLSALGFYEVTPGVPEYCIGSPRFDDMLLHLPSGKALHILAKGAESGKVYVHSVMLNDKPILNWKLTHAQIIAGGTLKFEMSDTAKP